LVIEKIKFLVLLNTNSFGVHKSRHSEYTFLCSLIWLWNYSYIFKKEKILRISTIKGLCIYLYVYYPLWYYLSC